MPVASSGTHRSAARTSRSVAGLGLLILLAGCGPSIKGLQHDSSFSYESLQGGRIGVGGVTSLVHEDEDPAVARSQLASQLRAELVERDLEAVPAGVYRSALGAELYESLLDDYRLGGLLSSEALSRWAALPDAPRYLAFARVESDLVTQDASESEETQGKEKHAVTKLSSKREVTIAFQVYDLTLRRSVWSALLTDYKTNSRKVDRGVVTSDDEKKDDDDKSFLEQVGDALLESLVSDSDGPRYPEPPTRDEVIRTVFRGFAKNLPAPD